MDNNSPDPVDSGFDEPDTSPKPWPLCFTIMGLALILAVLYALLFAGCTPTPTAMRVPDSAVITFFTAVMGSLTATIITLFFKYHYKNP